MIVGLACNCNTKCAYPGCEKDAVAKGACQEHYGLLMPDGSSFRAPRYKRTGKTKLHPVEYKIWLGMQTRCNNKNRDNYKHYGGSGITVSPEWSGPYGFDQFFEDMGERPSGMTLDRINPEKGYCKENCRWASASVQNINKKIIKTPYIHFDKKRGVFRVEFRKLGIPGKQFASLEDAERYRDKMLVDNGREEILKAIKLKGQLCC